MTFLQFRSLQTTALGGVLMLLPALGHAQQTFGSETTFNFYGHLNIGVLTVDDGVDTDSILTDNDNSNSRFGFTIDTKLNNGNDLRFQFETAIGLTGSGQASPQNDDFDIDPRITDLRRFDLIYTTQQYGRFYIGQGSTATDGIAERDLSQTSVVTYSSLQDRAGGLAFRLADGTLSNVSVGQAFSAFDGGRRFRVRYDTPKYAGFTFSGSYGTEVLAENDNREFTDFGVSYAHDTDQITFQAALGFAQATDSPDLLAGSASVLHKPTGLNFTLAAGENQESDANYYYAKVGIVRDWFGIGNTAIAVDFTEGNNFNSVGSESESTAISIVQKVDRWNTELFASYRTFSLDDESEASFQDLDTTFIGARWSF